MIYLCVMPHAMILQPIEQIKFKKNDEIIDCKCDICHKHFNRTRKVIWHAIRHNIIPGRFCSYKCVGIFNKKNRLSSLVEVDCKQCGKKGLKRNPYRINHQKNQFCSRSCLGHYKAKHNPKGYKRSKLEKWLEEQLRILYPKLDFLFNDKTAINPLELDIYIPSLKLAFELNGIFHYEPIYGEDKLKNIQERDQRRFSHCIEKGIGLTIIDSSSFPDYFKEVRAKPYLEIITKIIDSKILS